MILNIGKSLGIKRFLKKNQALIFAIQASPFEGIGKPEQLKHGLSGRWSRRIDREHRIVYRVGLEEQNVEIIIILGTSENFKFYFDA